MTALASLTEDFAGAAPGTAISTSNTIYDNVSGSPTTDAFHASGPADGPTQSQRIVSGGGTSSHAANLTTNPQSAYFSLYLYLEADVTGNTAIMNWFSGATKIGDLRIQPGRIVQLRDNNTSRWTSTAIALNEWHRIEIHTDPGSATGHEVRIFSGTNRNGATPDQTSGSQAATASGLAGTATVDELRLGSISGDATLAFRVTRLRGDDAVYPAPIAASNTAPTADAGPDQVDVEPFATVTLDGTGSSDSDGTVAGYAWAQTGGSPTVTLDDDTAAQPTFEAPATMAGTTLTFSLVVTDDDAADSAADTVDITVLPHNMWRVDDDGIGRSPVRLHRIT